MSSKIRGRRSLAAFSFDLADIRLTCGFYGAPYKIRAFEDTWSWDQRAAETYDQVVSQDGHLADTLQAFRQRSVNTNARLRLHAGTAPRRTKAGERHGQFPRVPRFALVGEPTLEPCSGSQFGTKSGNPSSRHTHGRQWQQHHPRDRARKRGDHRTALVKRRFSRRSSATTRICRTKRNYVLFVLPLLLLFRRLLACDGVEKDLPGARTAEVEQVEQRTGLLVE